MFRDKDHKVELESRNALLQFDHVRSLYQQSDGILALSASTICDLQYWAIHDIYVCAGEYRDSNVHIQNTTHQPPPHEEVPDLVQEMCRYANSVGDQPIHAAAYLMWAINWIHPFFGGNGRTSRAASYLALCVGFDAELPGTQTVPDLIESNRSPYYDALDAADAAWENQSFDVSQMEALLSDLLTQQLQTAI